MTDINLNRNIVSNMQINVNVRGSLLADKIKRMTTSIAATG
jgi:hypothetical protein